MRNISAWAIRNPVVPIVIFVALTLAGIVSFLRMDINNNPDISFPAAQVIITQPGAAPTELETQVTQRVEAAVRGINGVDEIISTVNEGTSTTFVQFELETPVDRAVNDVRDAVSKIRGDLPEGILEPQVVRVDISGAPIAYFAAEAVDMTIEDLSWYVDNTVIKRLMSIEGMARSRRGGGVSREIRVILDPVKLQAHGLTAAQVNAQLREVNLNATGGRAEVAGSEQSVRVIGNAGTAYELGQTEIRAGGRGLRLADIATVKDLYAEQREVSIMDGRQVLAFSVEKSKGSSDLAVYDDVKAELARLEAQNPKVKFRELYTSAPYTKSMYDSAMEAMIEGAVLAVIVVFLFLRDWRAMLISALAIPLSAIPAFWFMDMMGFTLNTISLLALSLVAGVLVDDAIVEIENIVRHMRMGKSAYQASIDAADEIGLAVVATTMSIVAVFLPVGMMSGIIGQYFKQFGLTVVITVLMSLAVARLITPLMAAYFLKAHGKESYGEGRLMNGYLRVLHWSLANRWKTMGIGVAAFALTIVSFATLPMTFQPELNYDNAAVSIEMPPGTTLDDTRNAADRASAVLREAPEVVAAFADVQVGKATIYLTLKPARQRERTSTEFERAYAPLLRSIPDARMKFLPVGDGPPPDARPVTIMLVGDDPDLLYSTAQKLAAEMATIPELRAPRIEGELRRPEITIKPRFDLAASLGVTTAALSQTVRIATIGDIDQNVAKFSLSDRQIPIRVSIEEQSRRDLSTIENLPVPTADGGSVPLKVVADIGFGSGPVEISRYKQQRRIVVGADVGPGIVTGEAQAKAEKLPVLSKLPAGIERAIYGTSEFQQEMISNFATAVVSGILLVFAVLVLLYKRVMPPFVNMGSLLLAPLGGAIALHLTGFPLSMPVLIGLLMLLGIVAKNSILLVDFAIEEMARGADRMHAVLEAGHKRAQPIVMTTVAMVAGMIPTTLAISGDPAIRAPMGVTVIGGLILSTVLTLVIVPASFTLADDFEKWLGAKFKRYLTTGGGGAAQPGPQPAE